MIKLYEVTIESDVYAISLVDRPAIEENFIYLAEQKPQTVLMEDADKHLIVGAVLVPDKPIYRNQGGEEFYIQFSKETIEHLAYQYLMSGRMYSTTTDHKDIADDVVVVESWLKSSENDKSVGYGMDLPIGTWLAAMKVQNEDVWQRIKAGELKGYSVEAFVNLDEIKFEKHDMNEEVKVNENFWDRMKELIASFFTKEEVEQVEETVELAEEEVEAPIEEEVPVDPIVEEVVDTVETIDETPEEVKEDLQAIINGLNAKIAEMEGQIAGKDAEIEELKKQNVELSAQPSAKQIKVNASHVEESISFLDYASGRLKLK